MRILACVVALAALFVVACGGDDDEDTSNVQPTAPTGAMEELSDGNAPGIPPLAGEIVEAASGLRYIDEVTASGPTPTPTQCVTVHYTGWLTNGTQFDSSVARGQPSTFALSGVIAGWTEGVGSMQVGGKRRLIIPPELAYGAAGRPPTIGPNATLIFDVELISIGGEPVIQGGRPVCA